MGSGLKSVINNYMLIRNNIITTCLILCWLPFPAKTALTRRGMGVPHGPAIARHVHR